MKPRGRPPKPNGRNTSGHPRPRQARRLLAALLRAQRRITGKILARRADVQPKPAPTRAQSIRAIAADRELIAAILLIVPSAAAMLLTYRGTLMLMAEHGEGLMQKGEALIFALAMGVLVFLGWAYLFAMVHWLRGRRLAGALAAGGIYVTIVASVDAPFNMLSLGGGAAVQMSLVDTATAYERARTDAIAQVGAVRRLVPGLRAQAARFAGSETRELKGADTGSPRPGKVSGAYADKALLLGRLADDLDSGLAQAATVQGEITAALARMKTQVHRQGAIRARVEGVSIEADRIDELLGRLAQLDMTVSIRATLKSLEGTAFVPKIVTKPFEAIQNEQLAQIAEQSRSVAQTLQQALGELPAAPTARAERVRPADAMTAIRTYWRPLLPQWLAALFVDLAPALLLFILLAARREAEAAERHNPREGEPS